MSNFKVFNKQVPQKVHGTKHTQQIFIFMVTSLLNFFFISTTTLLILSSCSTSQNLKTKKSTYNKTLSEETVLVNKNNALDFFIKGTLLMGKEYYSKALNQFYQALLYDSENPEIYTSLANCLIHLGQFETAEINLLKATSFSPKDIDILMMLAAVQVQLEKDDAALQNYLKINKIEPQNIKAFEMICYYYSIQKKSKKLLDFIKKHIAFIEPTPDIAYSIATYYYQVKEYAASRLWVQKVLKRDSEHQGAKLLDSQLDLISGKSENAFKSFYELYQKNPNNERILLKIVTILREKEEFLQIIRLLKEKKELDIQNTLFLGEAYYKTKQYKKIQNIYADINMNQHNIYFQYIAADTELKLHNYETAYAYFADMIKRNPKMTESYYGAAYALIQQKQFREAKKVLREGLIKSKNNSNLYPLLSEILYELNQINQSKFYIEKLVEKYPRNSNHLAAAAYFYQRLKEFDKSDSLYEKALYIDSNNTQVLNNYSYSLAVRNIQLKKALIMIKRALVEEPNNSFYLDTIGWIYFKMKKYKLAQKFVKKSLDIRAEGQNIAEVYEHLGDIYHAIGDKKKAISNWKKALEKKPSLQSVKDKLGNLNN